MNCKEIHTITKRGGALPPELKGARDHIRRCASCKRLLLSERLAPAIIRAASGLRRGAAWDGPNAMLVARIKRRIREISEQQSGSWEAAIGAVNGWLAAFAVTAILLIAASVQWRPPAPAGDLDLMTQNVDEHLIGDAPSLAGSDKDKPYADK